MSNLFFSRAAQENIDETGIDPMDDHDAIRQGSMTPAALLAHCLDGADEDRRQGWLDYANEVCRSAFAEDGRTFEPMLLPEASA